MKEALAYTPMIHATLSAVSVVGSLTLFAAACAAHSLFRSAEAATESATNPRQRLERTDTETATAGGAKAISDTTNQSATKFDQGTESTVVRFDQGTEWAVVLTFDQGNEAIVVLTSDQGTE